MWQDRNRFGRCVCVFESHRKSRGTPTRSSLPVAASPLPCEMPLLSRLVSIRVMQTETPQGPGPASLSGRPLPARYFDRSRERWQRTGTLSEVRPRATVPVCGARGPRTRRPGPRAGAAARHHSSWARSLSAPSTGSVWQCWSPFASDDNAVRVSHRE